MCVTISPLEKSEIQTLLDLMLGRAQWLARIGKPMWNPDNLEPTRFEQMYPGYAPYLIKQSDQIAGGFVLLRQDRFLWSAAENEQSAYYIHKLVIKPEFAGRGIAKQALTCIRQMAEQEDKQYLRLDCYGDRENLVKLYEDSGFCRKRSTEMEDGTILFSYELAL